MTGLNGAGKSTLIQSLAVLKQTLQNDIRASQLLLNGSEVGLGTFNRVVHDLSDSTHFTIGVGRGQESLLWRFEAERDDVSAHVTAITIDGTLYEDTEELLLLLPAHTLNKRRMEVMESIASMSYLTSERPTPQVTHRLELPRTRSSVGRDGSYAIALLHLLQDQHIDEKVRHSGTQNPRLIPQVEAWMRELFPGFRMQILRVSDSNLVTLGIRLSDAMKFHEPAHTGYGLSQVLPVVIAALVSGPGDILAVENPENDLHPRGQALVGEFLCRIAASGVQVIVESHSDHVLNGIRRGVKQRIVDCTDTIVHFLDISETDGTSIESLEIDSRGTIESWPVGFFDQLDHDLEFFADWDS